MDYLLSLNPQVGAALTWIGTAAGFAWFMANILEKIPGWDVANTNLKLAVSLASAILLGLASAALTTWVPSGVRPDLTDVVKVLAGALAIWYGSQIIHEQQKKSAEPSIDPTAKG